jgi:hypothetical protein
VVGLLFKLAFSAHYSERVRSGQQDSEAKACLYLLDILEPPVLFGDVDWFFGEASDLIRKSTGVSPS